MTEESWSKWDSNVKLGWIVFSEEGAYNLNIILLSYYLSSISMTIGLYNKPFCIETSSIYNTVYQLILFSKLLSCTTRPNTDLNYEENIPNILVIVHLDVQIKCFKNRYTWLPIIVGKLWHLFYIKLTLWWTSMNLLTLAVMF